MNRREKREKKKELNVLGNVITIIKQYFPELINKFEGLTDLRHQSYVTYKMKDEFPRLRIIISGDALYASKPVMDICKGHGWKYIIRFKEGAIPTLYREFETIVETENESNLKDFQSVTKLDYQER